jgi:hypothetical protein
MESSFNRYGRIAGQDAYPIKGALEKLRLNDFTPLGVF